MTKKDKPERKYKIPTVICRGCGKECPSIRSHLKKLSCRSKYTTEERNEFEKQAKEIFNLNRKYDPIVRQRAQVQNKQRYENKKKLQQSQNNIRQESSSKENPANKNITQEFSKGENGKNAYINNKNKKPSINESEHTPSTSKTMNTKDSNTNCPENNNSSIKNFREYYNAAVLTKSRILALFEENDEFEMTLANEHEIIRLKIETINTIINTTTDNLQINARLTEIENEITNILTASTNMPKIDKSTQCKQGELSSNLFVVDHIKGCLVAGGSLSLTGGCK